MTVMGQKPGADRGAANAVSPTQPVHSPDADADTDVDLADDNMDNPDGPPSAIDSLMEQLGNASKEEMRTIISDYVSDNSRGRSRSKRKTGARPARAQPRTHTRLNSQRQPPMLHSPSKVMPQQNGAQAGPTAAPSTPPGPPE